MIVYARMTDPDTLRLLSKKRRKMELDIPMKRIMLATTLAAPLLLNAQELNKPKIALHTWATGFNRPVVVANCGDSRLFVVEQAGVINIVTDSMTVVPTPFLDITNEVQSGGNEQGLLGMAFEPDYADSGYFYVYYIHGSGAGSSRISRFHVSADPNIADPASEQVIFEYPQPATNHNGGDMHFGPDGYLYLGLGDGGNADDTPQHTGQNLTDPLGGIIRIDVSQHNNTFAIPPDNPWANAGLDTLRENWMWGLRNPWRWSFDRLTGDVWIGDVGQNAWEEIDFWLAGDNSGPNFGWSCREGLVADAGSTQTGCHPASFYHSPVAVFGHNIGWQAIIGGYVYRGTQYPHLNGHYIFTDYAAGDFMTFSLGTNYDKDTLLLTTTGGYAAFGEGSDGAMYVANEQNGQVKKIVDACPMAAPTVTNNGTTLTSTVANSYQWYRNGTAIGAATQQSYTPTTGGFYWVVGNFGAPCVLRSDTTTFLISGIEEIAADRIAVYPQPAKDDVVLERRSALDEDLTVDVLDALGRIVASSKWKANDVRIHLDVSALPTSNYFIRALDRSGVSRLSAPLLVTH